MSLLPMKCNLCGKIIPQPEIIIGEDLTKRKQRTIRALMQHMQKRVEMEARTGGPHLKAMSEAAQRCNAIAANLNGVFLTEHFELPEELQADRRALLREVHELTRQVRTSDEDLEKIVCQMLNDPNSDAGWTKARAAISDLRDRYESRGKYAPAKPADAPAAPVPDMVVKQ